MTTPMLGRLLRASVALGMVFAAATFDARSQPCTTCAVARDCVPQRSGGLLACARARAGEIRVSDNIASNVGRDTADRGAERINLREAPYNAKCDGVTDDGPAINAWLNGIPSGGVGYAPPGTCVFRQPLVAPLRSDIVIVGDNVVFTYDGAQRAIDLMTIGDGSTELRRWTLRGLTLTSRTRMTGGAALHIRRLRGTFALESVNAGLYGGDRTLWNGVWFDDVQLGSYVRWQTYTQNEQVIVNGRAADEEGADLLLDKGTMVAGNVCLHVGGGFGGLYVGQVLAYGCGTNYLIDNGVVARANRELLFGPLSVSDQAYNDGIHVNDKLAGGSSLVVEGLYGSSGRAGKGAIGHGIYIEHFPHSFVSIKSPEIFNNTGSAIKVGDPTTTVDIADVTRLRNNGGWAIDADTPTDKIDYQGDKAENNAAGNFAANSNVGWQLRNMAIPADQGDSRLAEAASIRFRKIGPDLEFVASVRLRDAAARASSIALELPYAAKVDTIAFGAAQAGGRTYQVQARTVSGSTRLLVTSDGGIIGGSGASILISGRYEWR